MYQEDEELNFSCSQVNVTAQRFINPHDISTPPGYQVEVFAYGLDTPINMVFTENGDMLIADAGILSGNPKVLRLSNGVFEVVADGFRVPLTGINYLNGDIYVSHRGRITIVRPDGTKEDIMTGLPSSGDHSNNQVIFGVDGKMYFGQGTTTNSGVVGLDNEWVMDHPLFHDIPSKDIVLTGVNYVTENPLIMGKEIISTGAFSPFGVTTNQNDEVKGFTKSSGCILKCNLDGTELELVAWGLRNPTRMKFDHLGRLFAVNHGCDIRGSRPIANCPDEFLLITPNTWYGWPDYSAGLPITMSYFKPVGKPQPKFLLNTHPMIPPKPFAQVLPHAGLSGFDFNYNKDFGPWGDVYIAEMGRETPTNTDGLLHPKNAHRISHINMKTGEVRDFASNKSGDITSITGGGGFERPTDVAFGPDGTMYVLDFGIGTKENPDDFQPNTGVIWRISRI